MKLHLFLLAAFALASNSLSAAEPSFFRNDYGVSKGKQLLPKELASEANVVWKRALSAGNSSPCIYENVMYLTTHEGDELATVAVDFRTGDVLWERVCPAEKIESFHQVGSPASCTPACDGKSVYAFFGSFGLLCYDLEGELKWSKKMGPFQDEFGASSSPVIVDDKVILNQDHDIDSFLIALDKNTGDEIWRVKRPEFTRSYATPIVWKNGKQTQLIVAGALQLNAYDVDTGKRIWWFNGLARIVNPTPSISGNMLYMVSWTPGGDETERISMGPFADAAKTWDKNGDGKIAKSELPMGPVLQRFFRIDLDQDEKLNAKEWAKQARVFELAQNAMVAIKLGGEGDITDTHVAWRYRRSLPNCPSPLVYNGVVYMAKNSGILTSLDAKTGKVLKQGRLAGRGNYYASPVAGDGKIYIASEGGVMTIVKAGREWETIGEHDFGERIMASPVVVGGRLVIRTDEAVYCFGKR
ncbi:MAG: pyrrolo-quinoline quinone [Planctomycetaceae bacterium]|nr:pyrrolo-quinoline quinone [Planctomycetaceae bacterium]